jgi:tetratricopeptide (TPR) repeat protein
MLQDAVQATQSGDLARARKLLLKLLHADNREPLYWLLMSTAVESREERIYCLQNVLFLDAENSAARHDLELLGAEIPEVSTPAFVPEESEDWQTKEIAAPKIRKRRKKKREEPWPISWILASLGVGVVVIFLGYYAAESGLLGTIFSVTPGPERTLSATGLVPTRTPSRSQATATGDVAVVPRSPEDLLDATYTPTPIYVNTPQADLSTFDQGLAALNSEDWDTAIVAFQSLVAANSQSADASYYLGLAQLGAGDLLAAQAAFNQSVTLGPQFAPGYLGRARVGMAQGAEATSIITDLNTAILLDSNFVEAYLTRAQFNMQRESYGDAEGDIASAEDLAPGSALVQYYKALVALAQDQFGVALQASQRAHDLDVTLLPNYLAKAEAELGVRQAEAAIGTMQTYLTFEAEDGFGWQLLGLAFEADGQHESAMEAFNHALSINPNLPRASYYRGLEELAEDRLESALGYFRAAVAGEPDWFEAHIALAEGLLATGAPSDAFLEINASSSLIEDDTQRAAFFYWRARILEALGQTDNALADWRSLLALPESALPATWRQEALERIPN